MLGKNRRARIIACLDVKHGTVVKGTQFRNHEVMGDALELAKRYNEEGADELVVYDIAASAENTVVDKSWIQTIADVIDIPFCVAGGIRSIDDARDILSHGADKVSINSPALERPELITELVDEFGADKIVVGIDTFYDTDKDDYFVFTLTGDETKTNQTQWRTLDWVTKVQELGADEIVLNMMNQDGVREGYDILQLQKVREICKANLIASGGAGAAEHFRDAYLEANVDGTLGASAFHKEIVHIGKLKAYLKKEGIEVAE